MTVETCAPMRKKRRPQNHRLRNQYRLRYRQKNDDLTEQTHFETKNTYKKMSGQLVVEVPNYKGVFLGLRLTWNKVICGTKTQKEI